MYNVPRRHPMYNVWFGLVVSLLLSGQHVLAQLPTRASQNHYWQWGWGTYDATPDERNIALFDWSFIHVGNQVNNFGRIGDDRQLVDRINTILELNPQHKFVVLFWPLFAVRSDNPSFSLFDYLYNPQVKKKLNTRIQEQAEIVTTKISNPRAVVAMTFLEELPGHVTSQPYANSFNNALTDLHDNARAITAELGRPFDKARDRQWWGRKYCDALAEIHSQMKKHIPHAKIFYWQAERYYTLDHVNEKLREHSVLPFDLKQILRGGLCDGIFGYINTPAKLRQQTIETAEKYRIPYFTQLSVPADMIITDFPTALQAARLNHPLNLGTFLFKQDEVGDNRVQKKSVRRYLELNESELLRTFCYENKVNTDVVENNIAPPQIFFSGDLRRAQPGDEVTVTTVVYNQRNASWFGMNDARAALYNLTLTLKQIPPGAALVGAPHKSISHLMAERFVACKWKLRLTDDWVGYETGSLKAELTHARLHPVTSAPASAKTADVGMHHHIRHNRGTWLLMPPHRAPARSPQIKLHVISQLLDPKLTVGNQSIAYRGELHQGELLTIGPGQRARLLPGNMLSAKEATCGRTADQEEMISDRYTVWGSHKYSVTMGGQYEVVITGRVAGGAREALTVNYLGKGGNWNNLYTSVTPLTGKFTAETSTQRVTITIPKVDGKSVFARLLLYNQGKQGHIALRRVVLKKAGGEQDVTERLTGELPALDGTPTIVKFEDQLRAFAAYWRVRIDIQLP